MARPSNQGLDAGEEFEHAERLRDVVVGAEPEAEDFIGFFAARCENENGYGTTLVAQGSQHSIPVHARQHEVEDDEVRVKFARARDAGDSILGDGDFIASDFQAIPQPVGEVRIVLDDEHR